LSKETDIVQQQCLTPLGNKAKIDRLFNVETKEKKLARQVVWLQIVVTMVGVGIAYSIKDKPQFAIAVLSGGAVSTVNGAMLAWKMSRSALHPAQNMRDPRVAQQQLRFLYLAAAERFLVVIALYCFCMIVLKLAPLALLAGFAMGQTTLVVARLILNRI
jgi:ATP synthase protein I